MFLMASKFDYLNFHFGDITYIAFNASKYTVEQAEEIAKTEVENPFRVKDGWVWYGFGRNEDEELVNGIWLKFRYSHNGIPVIVFKEGNQNG